VTTVTKPPICAIAGLSPDLVLYLARHECGAKICREKGIEYARRLSEIPAIRDLFAASTAVDWRYDCHSCQLEKLYFDVKMEPSDQGQS
jgi:hypothetical protein